ncbi:MAG: hypothetical protein Kow0022_14760 [Phycisphaerales bacterium]
MTTDPIKIAGFRRFVPNALTALRVALAGVVVVLLSTGLPAPGVEAGAVSRRAVLLAAASVFVAAAVTDALDGFLARKWNVVSLFGRVVDPFADKLLVLGSFVCLAGVSFADPRGGMLSGVQPWMVVVILARELLVTTLRGVYESRGVDFSATGSGKAKMILQSGVVPAVLVLLATTDPAPGSPARRAIDVMVWAAVAVTAWSGVPYVVRAWKASGGSVRA